MDLAEQEGPVAVNRNFARTPDHRVSQSPELHVSSICQFPGSPESPPPAVLTSVICNGFLPRLFSSSPLRHLFLSFLCRLLPSSSVISFLSVLHESPDFPTSASPRNRGRGTHRVRRPENTPKVPVGGASGTKKITGGPSPHLKNGGRRGSCHPVSAPKYQKGSERKSF